MKKIHLLFSILAFYCIGSHNQSLAQQYEESEFRMLNDSMVVHLGLQFGSENIGDLPFTNRIRLSANCIHLGWSINQVEFRRRLLFIKLCSAQRSLDANRLRTFHPAQERILHQSIKRKNQEGNQIYQFRSL